MGNCCSEDNIHDSQKKPPPQEKRDNKKEDDDISSFHSNDEYEHLPIHRPFIMPIEVCIVMDEDGNPQVDENGDPLRARADGDGNPMVDVEGNIYYQLCNENGEPIDENGIYIQQ